VEVVVRVAGVGEPEIVVSHHNQEMQILEVAVADQTRVALCTQFQARAVPVWSSLNTQIP
jgi:hypothetical protein